MSGYPPGYESPTLATRFWAKVERRAVDVCWKWTGGTFSFGYGKINGGVPLKRTLYAHRVSFLLANGFLTDGLLVMHACDNPLCVNPHHLREGTHVENATDARSRGRLNPEASRKNALRMSAHGKGRYTLTCADARAIVRAVHTGRTTADVAMEFGVSFGTVCNILNGASRRQQTSDLLLPDWKDRARALRSDSSAHTLTRKQL